MSPARPERVDGAGLELRGVVATYTGPSGPVAVLDGVDLVVTPGEVVAVAGRSGSGKTTLLTIAAGWAAPEAGEARLDGAPLGPTASWAEVAMLPQSLGLLDELTIAENVALPARLGRVAGDPDGLLAALGLEALAARYPDEVSLGEQQRAALARAAVAAPRLLVADEPVSHQNRAWVERSAAILTELAAGGTAVLLASHDRLVSRHADRVLDLRRGRLARRAATP